MSVYEAVTQAMIAELEHGVMPWVKYWQPHLPQNLVSKREYKGINVILLWWLQVH
jgi:antirestriction protein ArdC